MQSYKLLDYEVNLTTPELSSALGQTQLRPSERLILVGEALTLFLDGLILAINTCSPTTASAYEPGNEAIGGAPKRADRPGGPFRQPPAANSGPKATGSAGPGYRTAFATLKGPA